MIFDTLDHLSRYVSLGPRYARAFALLREIVGNPFEEGKKESGDAAVYANRFVSVTKDASEAVAEVHRRFIDVHVVFSGAETILLQSPEDAPAKNEYDESGDCQLFSPAENAQRLRLTPGHFLLLFPGEVHTVGVTEAEPGSVQKIVVKIDLE